jgi:ABC-type transporter Mla MlaB component
MPVSIEFTRDYTPTTPGKKAALIVVVLRTTVLYLRDQTKVVLRGQLVGQWAESLPKAIDQCCSPTDPVEIDLDGITCVDHAGEQALLALWQAHRRFVCTSLFARALCEGLGIPVEGGDR